jgi:uncharacterized membrane protein
MEIEEIKFSQIASQRIYSDYMKRVKKATNSLSKEDQNDIYMEFNSHIYESLQHKSNANEIDLLLDVIERLGTPEEVLKPLVADKKLEQATKTFNPVHVFKALVLNFTNGISYVFFFLLYLLLFAFVFLIFAKIINPSEVGLFMQNKSIIAMGYIKTDDNENVREVLGNWFIPFTSLCILVFYFLITALLKFKKSINKRGK